MNVDFVKDDYRFNARASAIILNEKKDKILLFIEQLNSYKVYPESTIKLIKSEKLKHIIEKMEK